MVFQRWDNWFVKHNAFAITSITTLEHYYEWWYTVCDVEEPRYQQDSGRGEVGSRRPVRARGGSSAMKTHFYVPSFVSEFKLLITFYVIIIQALKTPSVLKIRGELC